MNRQDRGGVRTAQDLERKYDFTGMKKAIKQSQEGVNKTNKTLETFIATTLKSKENIQSQTDGQITTWYSHGEPTLASEPAVYWVTDEQKAAHAGDMYYDRDTGYAYEFVLEDGNYKWGIITDRATIESLAIANSAYDTEDNKRRVFVSEPYPPYDNGDLWFTGEEIYICQISKSALNVETGEAEVYAEGDFIIATKYTDDTVANQVGDELQVLKGTVLTVVEGVDRFSVDLDNLDRNTKASITLIEQSLKTLIKGANGQSLMTQTENGWEFNIESLINTVDKAVTDIDSLEGDTQNAIKDLENVKKGLEEVQKVASYVRVHDVEGEPHLELGTSKNGFKSVHTNRGIQFSIDDNVQTEITHEGMEIERAKFRKGAQFGGFLLKDRDNGNVGFVWRGDDD